jgi:dTDP-4-amino-4,6-dideoxygalactose transaminase
MTEMIALAKPRVPLSVLSVIQEILESGSLVQGSKVRKFEMALASFLGVEDAVALSSGTAALHAALIAHGIGPGDEVIVPGFTFPATANVVEIVGARPVFVDITLTDFGIDVDRIEGAISSQTKAIMPVHEFGLACDVEEVRKIADARGLLVIEDAACALGARVGAQRIGDRGDAVCFSFHPRKSLTTGEGGLVTCKDSELRSRIRLLRNHGIQRSDSGVDFTLAGLNYRMTELQAALGLAQVPHLEASLASTRSIARVYSQLLADEPLLRLPTEPAGREHVYQTYHVLIDPTVSRDSVIAALLARGIESNLGASALASLAHYRMRYQLTDEKFPNSVAAYRHGLAIPCGAHVTAAEAAHVADSLLEVLRESSKSNARDASLGAIT